MFTHDDILLPLAFAVIIDNKVRDPELAELNQQARALCELFDLPRLSSEDVSKWFDKNEPELREKLESPRKNTTILRALSKFSEDIHVENLYDAMVTISVSDKEYKREESELIKSAATIWGYQRPPLKVVD